MFFLIKTKMWFLPTCFLWSFTCAFWYLFIISILYIPVVSYSNTSGIRSSHIKYQCYQNLSMSLCCLLVMVSWIRAWLWKFSEIGLLWKLFCASCICFITSSCSAYYSAKIVRQSEDKQKSASRLQIHQHWACRNSRLFSNLHRLVFSRRLLVMSVHWKIFASASLASVDAFGFINFPRSSDCPENNTVFKYWNSYIPEISIPLVFILEVRPRDAQIQSCSCL